jgi:hypothetical protein
MHLMLGRAVSLLDSLVTAVDEERNEPEGFRLEQNYPNPFNPLTIIDYQLPIDNWITLKIYNLVGQEVTTLIDGFEEAGYRSVQWSADNIASGVYFYRLQARNFSSTRKLQLVK